MLTKYRNALHAFSQTLKMKASQCYESLLSLHMDLASSPLSICPSTVQAWCILIRKDEEKLTQHLYSFGIMPN